MAKKVRVIAFVFLLLFAFRTSASADSKSMKAVRISIDGEQKTVMTFSDTVEAFLKSQGIELNENDQINVPMDEKLNDAMPTVIKINTAIKVNVVVDNGEAVESYVPRDAQVGHVLQEVKTTYGGTYNYDGYLNDAVREGQTIEFRSVTIKEFTTVEKIAYGTEVIKTITLPVGTEEITQKGEFGELSIITEVTYESDEEIKREEASRAVTKNPVNEIKMIGQKILLPKTPNGEFEYTSVLVMEATAYSAEQPELTDYTKSGDKAVYGVVAVDPKVIPLGTWLYVEGYGKALASDTGSAILGNRIDLCYNSVEECIGFGRKNLKVYIIAE